jgi:endoglucanase Acf2
MTTVSISRSFHDEENEHDGIGQVLPKETDPSFDCGESRWKSKRDAPRQTTMIAIPSSSSSSRSSAISSHGALELERRDEENSKTSRQYHYFYGSTCTTTGSNVAKSTTKSNCIKSHYVEEDDENFVNINSSSDHHTHGLKNRRTNSAYSIYTSNTDDNSLVGEELLLTDQELDDMTATDDGSSGSIVDRIRNVHRSIHNRLIFVAQGDSSTPGESKPLLFGSSSSTIRSNSGDTDGPTNGGSTNNDTGNNRSEGRASYHHHRHSHADHHNGHRDSNSSQMLPVVRNSVCCSNRPCVRQALLGITVIVIVMMIMVVLFPTSRLAQEATTPESDLLLDSVGDYLHSVPFRVVDRGVDYNDPVSEFMDVSLFHPSLLANQVKQPDAAMAIPDQTKKNSKKPVFRFPFPTGAFWINLILPPTAERDLSYPIAVYPFGYKWSPDELEVSYPSQHRMINANSINDYFMPDLKLTTVEGMQSRYVIDFDALSVTLRYYEDEDTSDSDSSAPSPDDKGWETYLVQGSPYVTVKYVSVTPYIKAFSRFSSVACPREASDSTGDTTGIPSTIQHSQLNKNTSEFHRSRRNLKIGVCTTVNDGNKNIYILSGTQFVIQSQEGMEWIVFSSEPVTIQFELSEKKEIIFASKFNGILRFALIPTSSSDDNSDLGQTQSMSTAMDSRINQSTGLQRLIYHAGVYPKSGSVSWTFRDSTVEPDLISTTQITTKLVLEVMSLASPPSLGNTTPIDNDNILEKTQSSHNPVENITFAKARTSSSFKPKSKRVATISFKFDTGFMMSTAASMGNKPSLLMLALPHHAQSLDPSVQLNHAAFDLVYKCIKGPMRPVLGSSWSYDEPLLAIGFDGGTGTDNDQKYLQPEVYTKILENLRKDTKLSLPSLTENIYGFGKQAARLAQLAYIASVFESGTVTASKTNKGGVTAPLGHEDAEISTLKQEALDLLKNSMGSLLRDKTSDTLVYDVNMGGLVTSDGLVDSHADFGNGRYNDHHFHYGYLLYTAAIIGKLDPSFVEEYSKQIDAIYNDVAHESNLNSAPPLDNIFFPGSRHKIWFDGHSFASGMFPFGNGKSQESSSEAVNCYYGAYLWSLVRNGAADNPELDVSPRTDFARLLLATEIRGTKTYWHMVPPNLISSSPTNIDEAITVYPPEFSENYMVGNVGMLDAKCTTWFGISSLYVHMINLIPVTAITGELFGEAYASLEYNKILKPLGTIEAAWNGFVIADRAISDPIGAWNEAQSVVSESLDAGLSKTQLLYWIATRRGFNLSSANSTLITTVNNSGSEDTSQKALKATTAACSNAPVCVTFGLQGDCCPTNNNVFLECCHQ